MFLRRYETSYKYVISVFSSFEKVQNWEIAFYEQENILKHIEYGVIDFSYSIWQIEHHMKCQQSMVLTSQAP